MPLYDAHCSSCGKTCEYRKSYERRDDTPLCCSSPMTRKVSAPAFTPSVWGDSRWAGRLDKGLGVVLKDKAHRDRIMAQRGLVEDTAFDQVNRLDKAQSEHDEHERTVKRFEHNLREAGGDKGLALANTFPATD